MQRAYKTELDPNNEQRTLLAKSVGVARFAWNWALGQIKEKLDAGEKPESTFDLKKRLVALKSTELPWLAEVSKCCPEEALRNLNQAQQNFFRRLKRGEKKKGFPRFKRKGVHDSTRLYGAVNVSSTDVQLPRLGVIRLKERGYLPADVPIINATISHQAGHWFVSILVEKPNEIMDKTNQPVVGVDLGIKTLATCSDGTRFENPRSLKRNLRKLKRIQRLVSRRQKGSKNRWKVIKRLQRLHYRISCIRKDAIHKITTYLTKTKSVVVTEDLNVKGMMRNHCLAQAIGDAGLGEFVRQIKYKALWYGCEHRQIDRFFPSSKMCSVCGELNHELKLSDRTWTCKGCGTVHDRDFNASKNIEAAGLADSQNACGPERAQAAGMKQEEITIGNNG